MIGDFYSMREVVDVSPVNKSLCSYKSLIQVNYTGSQAKELPAFFGDENMPPRYLVPCRKLG